VPKSGAGHPAEVQPVGLAPVILAPRHLVCVLVHVDRARQTTGELAGEIEATHERLRRMIEDLEKQDSVILQFDPTHQVEAINPKAFRPPPDWARRGEMTKAVLSIFAAGG
jgi:hypothetical protein